MILSGEYGIKKMPTWGSDCISYEKIITKNKYILSVDNDRYYSDFDHFTELPTDVDDYYLFNDKLMPGRVDKMNKMSTYKLKYEEFYYDYSSKLLYVPPVEIWLNIISVPVYAKARNLETTWTVEPAELIQNFPVNNMQEIMDELMLGLLTDKYCREYNVYTVCTCNDVIFQYKNDECIVITLINSNTEIIHSLLYDYILKMKDNKNKLFEEFRMEELIYKTYGCSIEKM